MGLVASSLDYAGTHGVYVLDRATGRELAKDAVTPLARGVRMPDRSGEGTASARGGGVTVEFVQHAEGTTITASARGSGWTPRCPWCRGTSRWAWSCRGADAGSSTR